MATVLVPLAEGFEEIEAVSIIDILRRGDINVLVAGVQSGEYVIGAHNLVIKTDCLINEVKEQDIDMIVLPGGWGGTKILADDKNVQDLLKEMNNKNKNIGAICAAPFALDKAGVLKNRFTCYHSVENEIKTAGYESKNKVVSDQNILTSKGPGTAACFALAIVEKLAGKAKREKIASDVLVDFCD